LHRRVGEVRAGLLARLAVGAGVAADDDASGTPPPRIAIVTHAGVIRSWRAHAQSRPLMELFSAAIPFGHVEAAG
jgi:broad specificity phosphatase PhoE